MPYLNPDPYPYPYPYPGIGPTYPLQQHRYPIHQEDWMNPPAGRPQPLQGEGPAAGQGGGQWGFALHEDDDLEEDAHDAPGLGQGPPERRDAQNGRGGLEGGNGVDERPRPRRTPQGDEAPRGFAGHVPDDQSEGSDQSSIAGDSETARRRPRTRAQSVAGDGPGRNEQLQQPRRPMSVAGDPRRGRGGYHGFEQMGMGRGRGGGFNGRDDLRGFGEMNDGFMVGRGRIQPGQERNLMGFAPGMGGGIGRGW